MELLERADDLDRLRVFLSRASTGAGTLVLVAGEAGIGKTTLLRHFVDRVRSEVTVLWGACDHLTTSRPLAPILDMAATAGFPVGDDIHGVFADILDRLASSARPTIAVIEDAHWADEATLDL